MVKQASRRSRSLAFAFVVMAVLTAFVAVSLRTPRSSAAVNPVTFAVWGDVRPASAAWPTSQSAGFTHVVASLATHPRDFQIAVGDYIDLATSDGPATVNAKYAAFKKAAAPATTVPSYWTKGNHEVVDGYGNTATLDGLYRQNMGISGSVNYYQKLLPGDIHLIVLDTEMTGFMQHIGYVSETSASNSPQAKWLVSTLRGIAAGDPNAWIIVSEHRPIADPEAGDKLYHSSEQTALKALFAKYGVDLAVFGDTHYYRRHVEPAGPTYLVQGTGGAPSDPVTVAPLDSHDVATDGKVFGYTLFKLDATGMHGTTYEASPADWVFKVVDTFTVADQAAAGAGPAPTPTPSGTPTPTPTQRVLSVGHRAKASSSSAGHRAGAAVDGLGASRWIAGSPRLPQTWKVDLGIPASVTRVRIAWYGGGRVYRYALFTSLDGRHYSKALDQSGNTRKRITSDALSVRARFVRVKVLGVRPAGVRAGMREVTVSGSN